MKQVRTETDGAKPRVLMVDDERVIRDIISRLFEKEGYVVKAAASLEQALEVSSEWAFDVLVTDVHLGPSTGMDVIRQLRESTGRDFPIIVITGFALERSIEEARALGVHRILLKPQEIPMLISTVKKAWKDFRGPGSDSHTQHEECAGRGGCEQPCDSSTRSKESRERVSIQAVLQSSQKLPRKPAPKEQACSDVATAHSPAPQRPSHAFQNSMFLDSCVLSAHHTNTTILNAMQFKHIFKELDKALSEENHGRAIAWFEAHPDFTSTFLKFVGSFLFSGASAHSTMELLIRDRGIGWVKGVAYALTLFDIAKSMNEVELLDYGKVIRHCLTTAAVSYIMASKSENMDPEQATMAGLVHDIGKVMLASVNSSAYRRALVESSTPVLSSETETRYFGISHSTIMDAMAELCKFPGYLVAPVTRHHCDWAELMDGNNAQDRLALCIKAADEIAAGVERMESPEKRLSRLPAGVLKVLGIDSRRLKIGLKNLSAILQNLSNVLTEKQGELKHQVQNSLTTKQVLYIARPGTPMPVFLSLNRSLAHVITRSKLSAGKYYKAFTHIILNPQDREEAKKMLKELSRIRNITSVTVYMLGAVKKVHEWLAQYYTGYVAVRHFPSKLSCEDALDYFRMLESKGPEHMKTATAG